MDEDHKLLGNFEISLKIMSSKFHYRKIEKLLLKIGPSEIAPVFYSNLSISEVDVLYLPRWRCLCICRLQIISFIKKEYICYENYRSDKIG